MADWKEHGIRIVRAGELDGNTPQTPGMYPRGGDYARAYRSKQAVGGNSGGCAGGPHRRASSR